MCIALGIWLVGFALAVRRDRHLDRVELMRLYGLFEKGGVDEVHAKLEKERRWLVTLPRWKQ